MNDRTPRTVEPEAPPRPTPNEVPASGTEEASAAMAHSAGADAPERGVSPEAGKGRPWNTVDAVHMTIAGRGPDAEPDFSGVGGNPLAERIAESRRAGGDPGFFETLHELLARTYGARCGEKPKPQPGRAAPAEVRRVRDRVDHVDIPEGTLIAIAGRRNVGPDRRTVFEIFDTVHRGHPKMCLVHGNLPGAVRLAGEWARDRGVPQLVFEPDPRHGRTRIVELNKAIVAARPHGVIDLSPADMTTMLASFAEMFGIPVLHLEKAVDAVLAERDRSEDIEPSPRRGR